MPVNANSSLFLPVEARQDVHQRALARPVLPQQRVNLSRAQIKVYPIVGQHAGETFDDSLHLDCVDHVSLLEQSLAKVSQPSQGS